MVEHRLPKPGVAGSIPVSRFKRNNKIKSRSVDSTSRRGFLILGILQPFRSNIFDQIAHAA
jgi:hypothetical protein